MILVFYITYNINSKVSSPISFRIKVLVKNILFPSSLTKRAIFLGLYP